MSELLLILAGLFLPLFPLSMVFNTVFARIKDTKQRYAILLLWPQIGLLLVYFSGIPIPSWIAAWGLLTALLYAIRLLAIREMQLWISFLATSAWSVLWILLQFSGGDSPSYLYALAFSAPLILLLMLANELISRFGAAYTGLYGGLALTQPRFSGVLIMTVLAVIATPLFPAFFAMLNAIIVSIPHSLLAALGVGIVWLFWSWAGARLIQGFIIGTAEESHIADLNKNSTWKYAGALVGLIFVGLIFLGGLP